MPALFFISHPEVIVDPGKPVERWCLSPTGVDRMRTFSQSPTPSNVRSIWSSTETKAIEAAGILAGALGLGISVSQDLGENDRSATGFLPPDEFESVADTFFASLPTAFVDGNGLSMRKPVSGRPSPRSQTITGKAILPSSRTARLARFCFCTLSGKPIGRSFDQPFQGHYWTAALPSLEPIKGWMPIASRI